MENIPNFHEQNIMVKLTNLYLHNCMVSVLMVFVMAISYDVFRFSHCSSDFTFLSLEFRQDSCSIKDYFAHLWKLKVASKNIWESPPTGTNVLGILLSVARSLFQQVAYFL